MNKLFRAMAIVAAFLAAIWIGLVVWGVRDARPAVCPQIVEKSL